LIIEVADKVTARDYISKTIGEEYLVPVIGVYDSVDSIDFSKLPNKFVMKANNGWSTNLICLDKNNLDQHIAKQIMSKWLEERNSHYYRSYEWGYKDIPPRIICEEYLEPKTGTLRDYKILCINGKPEIVGIYTHRFKDLKESGGGATKALPSKELKVNYFDLEWQELLLSDNPDTREDKALPPPKKMTEMLELAKPLARPFPLVRVDFYEVDDRILCGELTFTPSAGFNRYTEEWDFRLGNLLRLPKNKKRLQYLLYKFARLFRH